MATLVSVLQDPARKAAVVRDAEALLEKEVAARGGLSGMAIRAGFATLKKVKPGIVREAFDVLLPSFAPAVDPHFATARASGDVKAYFVAHAGRIANDLLAVTDARAARARNRMLVKVYQGLRPEAERNVVIAMPGLAELCDKHVPRD